MNTDKLKYIVEIAKAGSLSIAAKNLYISQSALSQVVTQLEEELQITLFTRTKKGTSPTFQGKVVISKANEVLKKVQEFEETTQLYRNFDGELRLATIPGIMPILVNTIEVYKQDYPKIQISILQRSAQEIIKAIREHKIDAGLIALSPKYQNEINGLVFEPIGTGEIKAFISKDSNLAKKQYITGDELRKYPFVLYNDDYIKEFVYNFTEQFGDIAIAFTTDNSDAIRNFTAKKLGVSVGHDLSLIYDPYVKSGQVVIRKIRDLKQDTVQFGWIRSENTELSLETKRFIESYMAGLKRST